MTATPQFNNQVRLHSLKSHQQQQQNQAQQKAQAIAEFRQILASTQHLDGTRISQINQFASYYHALAAPELAQTIVEFIRSVSCPRVA